MGTPVPDDWPPLEDGLYYKITVDTFGFGLPPNTCSGPYNDTVSACFEGSVVRTWINLDHQCSAWPLIFFGGGVNQRIVDIDGPFDDLAACLLEL